MPSCHGVKNRQVFAIWGGTEAGESDHKIFAYADEEEQTSVIDRVRGKERSTCGKDQSKTKEVLFY